MRSTFQDVRSLTLFGDEPNIEAAELRVTKAEDRGAVARRAPSPEGGSTMSGPSVPDDLDVVRGALHAILLSLPLWVLVWVLWRLLTATGARP